MSSTANSYHQIHLGERQIIERLYAQGYKASRIAREIFRSRSTVTREIKRNGYALPDGSWQYTAAYAQRSYFIRMRIAPRRKWNKPFYKGKHEKPTYCLPRFLLLTRSRTKASSKLLVRPWRWKKEYPEPLINWHERGQGKAWRSWYNSRRRQRCYSWEEMGRKSKRFKRRISWQSPFSTTLRPDFPVNHFSLFVKTRKKQKEKKRDRWRLAFMRRIRPWWYAQPLPQSRKNKAGYSSFFFIADSKEVLPPKPSGEALNSAPPIVLPLISIAFSKLNRIAMPEGQLKSCFSKIPILFQGGSPLFFSKSA